MPIGNSNRNPFAEWDRVNTILFRYWSIYEEQRNALTSIKALKKHDDKFKREVQFLVRRSCDPDFHNFLNNRLDYTKEDGRKAGLVIRKHMKQLVKFILFDKILQDEGEFLKLTDPLAEWKDEEYQSYGHLLRMVDRYYPELITTKEEIRQRYGKRKWSKKRKIEDHRQRVVETQFSKVETQQPGVFDKIVSKAMGLNATDSFFDRMHMQIEEMQKTMVSNPIDLSKLLLFKEDVLQIIAEIGKNPFIDPDVGENNALAFNYLVQMLFDQVRLLVELRWFRDKSIDIQLKTIFKQPRITKYHKKDAAKAVNLSWEWFQDPEKVISSMVIAGISYIEFRKIPEPKVSRWLIEECLKQLKYPDEEKALAFYNIAMACQQSNEPRLMMSWLKKSLQLWEKVGGHPGDVADIYAYMAEYLENYGNQMSIGFGTVAIGGLLYKVEKHKRMVKVRNEVFLRNVIEGIRNTHPEDRLFPLGIFNRNRMKKLSDLGLWAADYKGWIFHYNKEESHRLNNRFDQVQSYIKKDILTSPSLKSSSGEPFKTMAKKKSKRLLIMSCSMTKRSEPGKAINVYDGQAFKRVREYYSKKNHVDVKIISAKYGLIDKDDKIDPYDVKMTNRSSALYKEALALTLCEIVDGYQDVFLYGGKLYQKVMPEGISFRASEGKIGQQLSQLKEWLNEG